MKIAFASCMDALDDKQQPVWDRIRERGPDALILLGDSVYMDFGLLGDRHLGWPRKASNQEFATALYQRYKLQWEVASFQNLLASGLKVGLIWDDHDFAWNDSRGAGTEKRRAVSAEKRSISRGLFLQFKSQLEQRLPQYPAQPAPPASVPPADYAGINDSFDVGNVRFILLDGRSFREDPNDLANAEMHGRKQRLWLAEKIHSWKGIKVIGAGSVLTHSRESWDQYTDYAWLLAQNFEEVVVLTGDIHKNSPPQRHTKSPPLYEITSSGAARPGLGGASGNFGILEIADAVSVTLYSELQLSGNKFPLAF